MASYRAIQVVLLFSIFYFVLTEVALSPFYPQFFEQVFGITELEYTAFYIFTARLTVVIAAPIWGWLAKRYEVKRLLYVGQWVSALMLLGMAGSTNEHQFLMFTIFLLIGKSSFLLIYPLLIELNGNKGNSPIAGKYHAIFHLAIICGTFLGAYVLKLTNPLHLFYGLAVFDILLWMICFVVLRGVSTSREKVKHTVSHTSHPIRFLVAIGLVIFMFHIANNMIRPYFTIYTIQDFSLSMVESSLLFMLPSFMAIMAYPFIKRVCIAEKLSSIYLIASFLLMMSLFIQGFTTSVIVLIIGRLFYGFLLALTQATLELFLFKNSSQHRLHMNYTLMTSFQNGGLLAAPLLASSVVASYSLAAPMIIAAIICVINLILARFTLFRQIRQPLPQEVKI